MNARSSRFHNRVEMVYLAGLVDLNRVGEVMETPTDWTKTYKVQISEIILCQHSMDKKLIFISVTKKYNSEGYEACYIKLNTKQVMYFGDCLARYLVHSFIEVKYDIYKSFSPFAFKTAQGAV